MDTIKPIIEIKGIGKEYNITHQRGGYIALRDILAGILKNPFRFAKHKAKQIAGFETKEAFWALRDVSFDVMPGEIIGIIGANGAGKSTLLKILTGITPPTEGEIIMRGRVASLLEVGTGFHPELTGRENIFLNGAILGMTKKEIARKFDEIVAFSGVEKFLDTPVKYYSSGMYVRLAFSVAAHMEPDILLVDEVLAVGDAEFQKKCVGKMEEVTHQDGRTILFVSHNLSAIQQLCKKTVLIEKGKIVMFDETETVVQKYLENLSSNQREWEGKIGDENIQLLHTWIKVQNGGEIFDTAADLEIGIEVDALRDIPHVIFGFTLWSEYGYELAYVMCDDSDNRNTPFPLQKGKTTKKFIIPKNTLAHGAYFIEFNIGIFNTKQIIGGLRNREADLTFSLENITGIGRQSQLHHARGQSSLFRPDWSVK